MSDDTSFDAVLIGGSFAGLSAALALGRSRRRILVIDGEEPCNRQTPHSHNFLTHDGEPPLKILQKARIQVQQYPTVTFYAGLAVHAQKTKHGFEVITQHGDRFWAAKLIFASGIKDQMPNILGFAACWGISVIHCPYCHGYEFKDHKTAIWSNGDQAFHLASMVKNLTTDLTILTSGPAEFSPQQFSKLKNHGIDIVETEILAIEHERGQIQQVKFRDNHKMLFSAMYASVPFEQATNIPEFLGCAMTPEGYLLVDGFQKTTVEGVYACGDNSSRMRSVAQAVATGNLVGAMVNRALVDDCF